MCSRSDIQGGTIMARSETAHAAAACKSMLTRQACLPSAVSLTAARLKSQSLTRRCKGAKALCNTSTLARTAAYIIECPQDMEQNQVNLVTFSDNDLHWLGCSRSQASSRSVDCCPNSALATAARTILQQTSHHRTARADSAAI